MKITNDLLDRLVTDGYYKLQVSDNHINLIQKAFCAAKLFFNCDEHQKSKFSTPARLEGYRPLGAEHDAITGRPDLSQSFSTWHANKGNRDCQDWQIESALYQAMTAALGPYREIAELLLHDLGSSCGLDQVTNVTEGLRISDYSYLQLNSSRPRTHLSKSRDTLMDAHEDGHLLTIIKPTQPGLVVSKGKHVEFPSDTNKIGKFIPEQKFSEVTLRSDELLVIPSSPTYFITGGQVKPLFHKVMNQGHENRQSLMYFVNPTLTTFISPWIKNHISEGVDIRSIVEQVSSSYGQASLKSVFY